MINQALHKIIGNDVMDGQRIITCSCGQSFSGSDFNHRGYTDNIAWGEWGAHFGKAFAHRIVSREKHMPFFWSYTVTCSCGKSFSGASFWEPNPDSKFRLHQENPDNPIWDSEIPTCRCDPRIRQGWPYCCRCGGLRLQLGHLCSLKETGCLIVIDGGISRPGRRGP